MVSQKKKKKSCHELLFFVKKKTLIKLAKSVEAYLSANQTTCGHPHQSTAPDLLELSGIVPHATVQ
jgi:hypothetical protein